MFESFSLPAKLMMCAAYDSTVIVMGLCGSYALMSVLYADWRLGLRSVYESLGSQIDDDATEIVQID